MALLMGNVKSVTIPEGKVKAIYAEGRKIWESDAGEYVEAEGNGRIEFVGYSAKPLRSARFFGETVQNGTPSPTTPAPIAVNNSTWTLNGDAVTVPNLAKIGEAVDNYDAQSGQLTRAVGKISLTGDEAIAAVGSGVYGYFALKIGARGYVVGNQGLCSRMTQKTIMSGDTTVGFNTTNSTAYNDARIVWRMPTPMSVAEMKVLLAEWYNAGAPMVVYYALSVPETEKVQPQIISQITGNNTLIQTSGSIPDTRAIVEYYGKKQTY